jgi:hypothetical protein
LYGTLAVTVNTCSLMCLDTLVILTGVFFWAPYYATVVCEARAAAMCFIAVRLCSASSPSNVTVPPAPPAVHPWSRWHPCRTAGLLLHHATHPSAVGPQGVVPCANGRRTEFLFFFSFSIISRFRWALTCDLASYAENSSLRLVARGSDCATPNTPTWPVPMGWPSGGVGGTTQWQGHCRVVERQWRAAPS